MKTLSRILVIAGGLALIPTLASAEHRQNNWWQWHGGPQDPRVEQGHGYGALTPWEARHPQDHNTPFDRALRRALRDGHLSKKEVRKLNKLYDAQNAPIYRHRHSDSHR